MGRHYTPEQKTQFSGGFIASTIAILLAIIAVLAWLFLGNGSEDTGSNADSAEGESCIEGNIQLPVASGDATLTQSLLASWNATKPVVRDHCVQAVVAEDIAKAAVYIDADSPRLAQAVAAAGRTAAASGEHPKVAGQAAGIYDKHAATDADVDLKLPADSVTYPGDSAASAVVASALADGPESGAELLLRDENKSLADADGPVAAVQAISAQDAGSFRALEGAYVEYAAVVLNQSDEIDEEQARAAQAFADDLAAQYHGFEANPEVEAQVEAETDAKRLDASPVWEAYLARTALDFGNTGSKHQSNDDADALTATDTLFLLDTSDAMSSGFPGIAGPSRFQASADAIATLAPELSAHGHSVALWNYSSPLNPGVTQGFRRNIDFSDGAETARSVQLLGTGGVPQTNEALLAAAHAVRDHSGIAQSESQPSRIVLITSGTADGYPDFPAKFREALGAKAELSVVHVGDGETDPALREVASHIQTVKNAAELEEKLRRVVGL
ncbi:vWA domain-containing protein [Corynebacterium pseudodiphtheriticum]|uniref:vWA domain-containing protein n=1 Tax=Corynebacterium pseudodiphtheriticum TaxID=37637 RepID=UPI000F869685|nr:vWA domain-containing protein [Corynebacterium pseudodiphtheriticum]MDK8805053.1 VWA domain-containing protein [Corynebacterium pseudodiphtheriticum]RUP88427.1 VWA domain-containing protein [Corynebacterium pseudodiphtheriticum]RUP93289.1 VWA domain-containing protein [Corynebacterium pseudodiphtheriticum]RUP98262.1 VWA domain-containing protein [Corynebacterium pseudodiphtheriticum]RUQ47113.1 VWA domain-containing protein [Corynebacterium pseudodiphtheriticum]